MGHDKALFLYEGKSLLQRAVDFCSAFCDEVLISSSNKEHAVEGILRIDDEVENCGPIGGIYSSLKSSSNEWNFVLSVDSPFVQKDFVKYLKDKPHGFDAVVPIHDGKKEPLIAFYHKRILPEIKAKIQADNYKLHFLLKEINTNFVESEDWLKRYPTLFRNLNYPEDINNIML